MLFFLSVKCLKKHPDTVLSIVHTLELLVAWCLTHIPFTSEVMDSSIGVTFKLESCFLFVCSPVVYRVEPGSTKTHDFQSPPSQLGL